MYLQERDRRLEFTSNIISTLISTLEVLLALSFSAQKGHVTLELESQSRSWFMMQDLNERPSLKVTRSALHDQVGSFNSLLYHV